MQNQHIPPRAKETRALARETLKGQWFIAILTTFIASLLGGLNSSSPNLNISTSNLDIDLSQYLPTEGLEAIDLSEMLMPILEQYGAALGLYMLYAFVIFVVNVTGIVLVAVRFKKFREAKGEHSLPFKESAKTVFKTPGVIFCTVLLGILTFTSLFS